MEQRLISKTELSIIQAVKLWDVKYNEGSDHDFLFRCYSLHNEVESLFKKLENYEQRTKEVKGN